MDSSPKPMVRQSKMLPWAMENELREGVFEKGDGSSNEDPDLIIKNPQSGCFGVCHLAPEGTSFVFYHESMANVEACTCYIGPERGPVFEIPRRVVPLRMRLMGIIGPCRMELKYAAIIIMKLFLGIKVPDELFLGEFNADYGLHIQQEGLQLKALWVVKEGEPSQYVAQLEFETLPNGNRIWEEHCMNWVGSMIWG
ncbi:hypothetical protein F4776DRAFT_617921 [Hypoxylon sp. NC0597]|nr:hypothetical protein F4776DRAFT_617921 [Hypoxylon sp. NC0597]